MGLSSKKYLGQMRKLLVACLVLWLGALDGLCQKKDQVPIVTTVTNVEYDASAWTEYKPFLSRFSVLLPGAPAEQTQMIDTAVGKTALHMSVLVVKYKDSFAVCYTNYSDFPEPIIDKAKALKVLDGARNELSATGARKFLKETEIDLDSYLGREVRFEDGDMSVVQRMYVVKQRFYAIGVGVPQESVPADEVVAFQIALRQRIFGSFTVLPGD
jgi:hypothetical protein